MKNKHLVLKKSAPETVEISLGMEFSREFKREKEPFSVSAEHAAMLLRSTDYFVESPDDEKTPPVKTGKSAAQTIAEEDQAMAVEAVSETAAAKQEKIEKSVKT